MVMLNQEDFSIHGWSGNFPPTSTNHVLDWDLGKKQVFLPLCDCQECAHAESLGTCDHMCAGVCVVIGSRFFGQRKQKVRDRCLFPSRRPRHKRLDLKQLLKKSEEDYVDFQEARSGYRVSSY